MMLGLASAFKGLLPGSLSYRDGVETVFLPSQDISGMNVLSYVTTLGCVMHACL